jgi:tRNA threonylcarbamoyladenosine biosynthesis protein TsaE
MQFISSGVKDTISFAENLSKGFTGGEVIALCGDLGAGKTHFSKGIAKGLGIKDTVTSPTFTIMQSYCGGRLNLYHCDMYRIEDKKELYETGFYEALSDKKGVCVIEWAEKIKGVLPQNTIYINIEINSKNKRTITVKD